MVLVHNERTLYTRDHCIEFRWRVSICLLFMFVIVVNGLVDFIDIVIVYRNSSKQRAQSNHLVLFLHEEFNIQ